MTATTLQFVSEPQNQADFAVFSADPRKDGSNLKSLALAWTKAISSADSHGRKCRACAKRVHPLSLAKETGTLTSFDPYQPCAVSLELWATERAAMRVYRAAGGSLPVRKTGR